jgi:hypothetical protein
MAIFGIVYLGHHPSYIIVWWGVTHLQFWEKAVKIGAHMYQEAMLQVVKPLNTTLFNGQEWVFQ